MIILEGPDGAGKSTLAQHLVEKFGLLHGERGTANRDELYKVTRQDTYNHLAQAVRGNPIVKVLDRLFVSEFVYADIVGRPCEFTSDERDFVVNILNTLHCPVILCLPPYEVVVENVQKAHQMEGVKDGLGDIYLAYSEGVLPWPDNVIHYDYTERNLDYADLVEVEEEVAGYLEQRKVREAWD